MDPSWVKLQSSMFFPSTPPSFRLGFSWDLQALWTALRISCACVAASQAARRGIPTGVCLKHLGMWHKAKIFLSFRIIYLGNRHFFLKDVFFKLSWFDFLVVCFYWLKQPWLFRVQRGWHTTQLRGDYFINYCKEPYPSSSRMECHMGFGRCSTGKLPCLCLTALGRRHISLQ